MHYSQYQYRDVDIQESRFQPQDGTAEVHLLFHIHNKELPFEQQLVAIQEASREVVSHLSGYCVPVLKRFYLSDAANQEPALRESLKTSLPCAHSVIEQAPLDGTKIALWVYLQSDVRGEKHDDMLLFERNGYSHAWCSGLQHPIGDSEAQTGYLFKQYEDILRTIQWNTADNCIRTWLYARDVDCDYSGVVAGRRNFFDSIGLTSDTHYIASTGIEGRAASPDVKVTMDAYAAQGLQPGQQRYLYAPTHLNPTYEYGVTFERGTMITYGDRRQAYISGTASIDNKGEVLNVGHIAAQTFRMWENVEALFKEGGLGFEDLAEITVYLRDEADYTRVRGLFDEKFPDVPTVILLAPVCRPTWLIEMECIAVKADHNENFKPF